MGKDVGRGSLRVEYTTAGCQQLDAYEVLKRLTEAYEFYFFIYL